jgi:hypothetical protein
MPASPQPVAFVGAFQLAADQSLPQDPIPFNFSGTYLALVADLLNVLVPGSVALPFGSIIAPGAKGFLIRYDAQGAPAAPVLVTINGGTQPIEISPGGMLVYFNPAPVVGIVSVSIAFAAACQLRAWVLG